jgi:hypothetical protein
MSCNLDFLYFLLSKVFKNLERYEKYLDCRIQDTGNWIWFFYRDGCQSSAKNKIFGVRTCKQLTRLRLLPLTVRAEKVEVLVPRVLKCVCVLILPSPSTLIAQGSLESAKSTMVRITSTILLKFCTAFSYGVLWLLFWCYYQNDCRSRFRLLTLSEKKVKKYRLFSWVDSRCSWWPCSGGAGGGSILEYSVHSTINTICTISYTT